MSRSLTVAKKELLSYFSSPTAYIFLGTYLLVSLFTFFWVEKFFSRNIADLRPLFEWMPILLVFLIATLTMRMWSEERRMGTVEFLLTLPVKTYELVLGKFLACMALVSIALALTLGLAVSVGVLGDMDWGPAIGAYFASLLLASAYTAIGLYISSKNDSQIISLILTVCTCGVLYVIGSELVVGFLGNKPGEILKLLGTGSRFSSISRGIIDLRDIYYYVSIAVIFLTANCYSLEKLKWSQEVKQPKHMLANSLFALFGLNLIFANVWLNKVHNLRIDMTENKIYSISPSTKEIIDQLAEPLLIRGYFSQRTHPLLAPLVPTIRDLMQEYKLVAEGKIQVELIDPRENEELEAEANRKYNIQPVPFQLGDRNSTSIVNSYFNLVIQYGDQHEVLGFNDLIEIKHDAMGGIDVQLRNLEYDLTRAMKKTMQSFNNTDSFFAQLSEDIKFVGYVSAATLPKQLQTLHKDIQKTLEEYQTAANGKLKIEFLDPSSDESLAQYIQNSFGFKPQSMSLFSQETFYFYLTLHYGEKVYSLGIPDDLNVSGFKSSMDATLKRMAPGFLKTAGVYTPPAPPMNPMMAQYGGGQQPGKSFRALRQKLEENYSTSTADLDSGVLNHDIDILTIMAPKELNEKQIFAIDQALMKGATVVLATSPVAVKRQGQSFVSESYDSGLEKWLAHFGVEIPKELVMDTRNSGFPALRKRQVGGITIREPYLMPYPFFIDVRENGLNQDNPITSGLRQVTMAWSSPIILNGEKNKERQVTSLIQSSEKSWRNSDISIEANYDIYPQLGFKVGEDQKKSELAVMIEGRFESYFKGKESPLLQKAEEKTTDTDNKKDDQTKEDLIVTGVIEKSPKSARLIIFATNEFAADDTLQIAGMLSGTQYMNPLQVIENSLDWSTQDRALLAIRSRGHFARTLEPMSTDEKRNWEIFNYCLAIFGLLLIYGIYRLQRKRAQEHFRTLNLTA